MSVIQSTGYPIYFQNPGYKALGDYLRNNRFSKIIILVDANTKRDCLPLFKQKFGLEFAYETIVLPPGEEFKNITTCVEIWEELSRINADRKSLVINLGGGVITDMGGFIASCFKRGIEFVNIPTTLLSMVDASVGGKTGIDLGTLKNQIGLFSNPAMVIIDYDYLLTVPKRELKSGLAEIIKYGYTFDKTLWETIHRFEDIDLNEVNELIYKSIDIKNEVVKTDMKETGLRKTLNFGHTIGHAVESYFLDSKEKENLTHGEAIAVGMVIEAYFSYKLNGFPLVKVDELKSFVKNFYGKVEMSKNDITSIIPLMMYDKKNVSGQVNFVLLKEMENCIWDINVHEDLLLEGFAYYAD
ncbi:3-dehydroquinate synthase [Namhaeicola litoreus]|uniref:3-dehydroquinate synthase n=1 Tax=Namhaeicola litoreus TaxID=1052145 RepID=A0ABW3Y4Y1_9FLAO